MTHGDKLDWWLFSNGGLLARIAIGVGILSALAAWDLARKGKKATRWREYLFLLAAAAAGMAYGAVNDSITSTISWEYFYYGKGLESVLGPRTPPQAGALLRQSMIVGMKAAGSAAVLVGAILLFANSASRDRRVENRRRPLTLGRLASYLGVVALATAVGGAMVGIAGYCGGLCWIFQDFREMSREGIFRPARFQCVYGIHLGSYVGGIIGTVIATWRIQLQRARITP